MPEPGKTPQPAYEGLSYGQNAAANKLATDADVDAELFGDDEEDYTPAGPEEEFLYGPTDRPDEPVTAGVGFGPGADGTRHSFESGATVLDKLAERIAADPTADTQAKAWANKRKQGL